MEIGLLHLEKGVHCICPQVGVPSPGTAATPYLSGWGTSIQRWTAGVEMGESQHYGAQLHLLTGA